MKRRPIAAAVALSLAFASSSGAWAAQSPEELLALLARNESQSRPPATEGEMKMVITNKAGQSRIREIKAYTRTEADGTDRQLLVFLGPADVRDTRFLTVDYKTGAKEDEQFIYIPALRKVRTIGTSGGDSKTGSFLGSDFTFADIGTLDRADFTVREVGEDSIDGRAHIKVEYASKGPATLKKYGYGKILRWIDAEHATTRRAEYYDQAGKAIKRFEVNGQHLVDGKYWQFESMVMSNLESGGKTAWIFVKTTNLAKIDEAYFTLRFLERGR